MYRRTSSGRVGGWVVGGWREGSRRTDGLVAGLCVCGHTRAQDICQFVCRRDGARASLTPVEYVRSLRDDCTGRAFTKCLLIIVYEYF
jgi:hypothetical protein